MYYAGYVNADDSNFKPFTNVTFRLGTAIKKAAHDSLRNGSRTAVMSVSRYVMGQPPEFVFSNGKALYGNVFEAYSTNGKVYRTVGHDEKPTNWESSSLIIRTPNLRQLLSYCNRLKIVEIKLGYNSHIIDTVNLKEADYA